MTLKDRDVLQLNNDNGKILDFACILSRYSLGLAEKQLLPSKVTQPPLESLSAMTQLPCRLLRFRQYRCNECRMMEPKELAALEHLLNFLPDLEKSA